MPLPQAAKQIIGSFETIGEDVAAQVKLVPKDVGQKALESIGINTGGKGNSKTQSAQPSIPNPGEPLNDWQKFAQAQDEKTKKDIARNALKALLENPAPNKPDDPYTQRIKEEEQKKQLEQERKKQQANSLPMPKGKPKQGSMFGMKQKTTAVENKATKSD